MEEGRAPSSIAGSQDALLTIPVDGHLVNQTMPLTMKIMQEFMEMGYGTI
jgi:hypothetical protein